MPSSIPRISEDQRAVAACRRRFSASFKQDALRLVTHEGYTLAAAAKAVGVSDKTLRGWRDKLLPPPEPCGPPGGPASRSWSVRTGVCARRCAERSWSVRF